MTMRSLLVLPLVALLGACATAPQARLNAAPRVNLIAENSNAAVALLKQADGKLPAGATVIATTIVNIDALESSSTFGRSVTEQVSSTFAHAGYSVVEMKFRDSIYMKRDEGELVLTREINQVARAHAAHAVVMGTYAEAGSSVYVSLKLINPENNVVLAATDYKLPMDNDVRALLGKRSLRY
jgi:TolB-like protein